MPFSLDITGWVCRCMLLKMGTKQLEALAVNDYDLLVLDLNLPDMDGLDICRLAREKHPPLLILILTARGKRKDIVTGLNNGADDYLIKPFHLQELLARIRALLRRDLRARKPILRIREISLDPVEKSGLEVRSQDSVNSKRIWHSGIFDAASKRSDQSGRAS